MKRQGDILFVRAKSIPKGLKVKAGGVIAEGEKTGHMHRLVDGTLYDDAKLGMFIEVKAEKASVTHNEHKTITLEKGLYTVKRQREYEPQGWRQVAD